MRLRVKDFDVVSPLRSQSIWHALCKFADAKDEGPILSFMRPSSTYVSLGNHRSYQEIDAELCERMGIPIYRRMAGGGTVLIDKDQLFFQLTIPSNLISASRSLSISTVLSAVSTAFNKTNVPCKLDAYGEVSAENRKLCGHGAMEIGRYMTIVGNLLEGFNYQLNSALLNLPWEEARDHVRTLMRDFVGPGSDMDYNESAMKTNIALSLGEILGLAVQEVVNFSEMEPEVSYFDEKLSSSQWVRSENRLISHQEQFQLIKIRAQVYVLVLCKTEYKIVVSIVFDEIAKITYTSRAVGNDVESIAYPSLTEMRSVIDFVTNGGETAFVEQILHLVNEKTSTNRSSQHVNV